MSTLVRKNYGPLIETLLAANGVWSAGEGRYRSACPFHKGENTTSLSIFTSGYFTCFKCHAKGDIVDLVARVRGMSARSAKAYVASSPDQFHTTETVPVLPPWNKRHEKPAPALREALLGPYRRHCPQYLLGRGFSQASLKHYEIGYDVQNAKIVIPVRDFKKRLMGLTYRLDFDSDKTQKAKYWHDHFAKAEHLYGFHFWAGKKIKRLYLVEGQLDVVRMYQLDKAAVAIMGSEISQAQVDLLVSHCNADQIVLAFDNDEAGVHATKVARRLLVKTRFGRNLASLIFPTNDPGELTGEEHLKLRPWWKAALPPHRRAADKA